MVTILRISNYAVKQTSSQIVVINFLIPVFPGVFVDTLPNSVILVELYFLRCMKLRLDWQRGSILICADCRAC